jgi:hypothetical protein
MERPLTLMRTRKRMLPVLYRRFALVAMVPTMLLAAALGAQGGRFNKQHVTFKSGELTLAGYLFKPAGDGPFPNRART